MLGARQASRALQPMNLRHAIQRIAGQGVDPYQAGNALGMFAGVELDAQTAG
jgi:hypothetical protein